MTYIEFFDRVATENISACLTYTPDRVIYVGDNTKLMNRHIAWYRRVFEKRGLNIEFSCRSVSRTNLDDAVAELTKLVNEYDDCVFDITGGDEILLLALGIVCARNSHRQFQIHRFNLRNGTIHDCDKDGKTIFREPPELSVVENIRIYGGDVVWGGVEEEKTYCWDLSEDFQYDVEAMWQICRDQGRKWNGQLGVINAICAVGKISEDGLTVTADIASVDTHLESYRTDYRISRGVLGPLLHTGLLTDYEDDGFTVSLTFKNLQVRKCLTKAGLALELKVYVTALGLQDDAGQWVYNDALNGVVIDWDADSGDDYDPANEVDILLMHGVVPVFVSCKNGQVTTDELYKLNTVAERFGGQYAKKVLIAPALESLGASGKYIRRRAKDMHIRIVEDIYEISDEELRRQIRSFWTS